jgi:hypothetical protein
MAHNQGYRVGAREFPYFLLLLYFSYSSHINESLRKLIFQYKFNSKNKDKDRLSIQFYRSVYNSTLQLLISIGNFHFKSCLSYSRCCSLRTKYEHIGTLRSSECNTGITSAVWSNTFILTVMCDNIFSCMRLKIMFTRGRTWYFKFLQTFVVTQYFRFT